MASFAVDMISRMTFHRIIAREQNRALRQEVLQEKSAQGTSQLECGPTSLREDPLIGLREDPLIGSGMSRCQWTESSQKVSNRVPSSGENGTDEQEKKALSSWPSEGSQQIGQASNLGREYNHGRASLSESDEWRDNLHLTPRDDLLKSASVELSQISGVSTQTISAVLSNRNLPGWESAVKIAKALKVSLDVFVTEDITIPDASEPGKPGRPTREEEPEVEKKSPKKGKKK
jgi:transcriptional regulator with XRE-family HTH domain